MAQVYLDHNFSMHTGPSQMEQDALLAKMYPVPRGPWMYAGMGALGISVADMVAACGGSGTDNCDPMDPGCVANRQALTTWAEDQQEANFPYGPATMPPCPTFNAAAVTQAFMSNTPVDYGPQTGPGTSMPVPALGPNQTAQQAYQYLTQVTGIDPATAAQYVANAPGPKPTPVSNQPPVQPAQISTATTPPNTPLTPMSSGMTNTGANLAQQNAGQQSGLTSMIAFPSTNWFTQSMIGGIPNWGLVAAGVALLFFAEKK